MAPELRHLIENGFRSARRRGRPRTAPTAEEAAATVTAATAAAAAVRVVADATVVAEEVLNTAASTAAVTAARLSEVAAEITAQAAAATPVVKKVTDEAGHTAEGFPATASSGAAERLPQLSPKVPDATSHPVNGADVSVRTEWATFLADPVMPRFATDQQSVAGVSFDAPGVQGLWRDISLARRMEAALRASEAQFEAAFAGAPTPMLVASQVAGRPAQFFRVNQALSRLTGYPCSDLLDFGFADLVHPEQPTVDEDAADQRPPDSEDLDERVQRWVRADGHAIWVRIRTAAVRMPGNQAEQLVCQIEDVTARRTVDAVLRSSERRFRMAFTDGPQPALLIELAADRLGQVFAANRAACQLLGRSSAEMLWLNYESLMHPVERPEIRALLRQVSTGALTHFDGGHRYRSMTGDINWLRLSARVVEDARGNPEYMVVQGHVDSDQQSPRASSTPSAPATAHVTSGLLTGPMPAANTPAKPAESPAAQPAVHLPTRLPPAGRPATEGIRLRVLLAEDDLVTQLVGRAILRKLGHHVDVVANGREAVEAVAAVQETPYDVVLMDVEMPIMDGFEATRRLRSDLPPHRQPRILAMTGGARGGREACLTAGMDDYLSKPVREVDLRAAMA